MTDEPKKSESESEAEPTIEQDAADPEVMAELASPYDLEEIENTKPPKTVKVKYSGPDGMSNDDAGGVLVSGETYEVPEDVKDELLDHPSGWWK